VNVAVSLRRKLYSYCSSLHICLNVDMATGEAAYPVVISMGTWYKMGKQMLVSFNGVGVHMELYSVPVHY